MFIEHQEWALKSPANLPTQARWLEYVAFKGQPNGTPLMLLLNLEKELKMKNVYNFTKYRLRHVRERKPSPNHSEVTKSINELHNLRWNLDWRHPRRRRLRTYYQDVPKHRGGHSMEGKLPATINNLLRRLVDETDPGMLLSIEDYQLSKYFQESFRAVKDKLDDYET